MTDPRYPIGEFDVGQSRGREQNIAAVEALPAELGRAVAGLSEDQLEIKYREGGWTLRQTVHHVADSHSNAFIRFKLALTEDLPVIRPYYEDRWAELGDSRLPVDISLQHLQVLHFRWAALLRSMSEADYERRFIHPDTGEWRLADVLALYVWHGRHHTAQILNAPVHQR